MKPAVRSCVLCVALIAVPSLAQTLPPDTAPPARGAVPDAPLSGPKVHAPTAVGLVEKDMAGKVRRLEITPEEAALEKITLSPKERADANAIVVERQAILDKAVGENVPLLLEMQAAFQQNNKGEQIRQLQLFMNAIRPLRDRPKLRDEIAAVLSPDNAAKFQGLVHDYWEAIIAEGVAEQKEGGGKPKPFEVMTREGLVAFGQEIKRAYERRIASGAKEVDEFLRRLNATGEQEATLRNIFTDYAQKTLGKAPTPEQQRALGARIWKELTWEQRKTLLQELAPTPKPKKPRDGRAPSGK